MAESYVDEIFEQPQILASLPGTFKVDHAAELVEVRSLMGSGAIGKIVLTGMGGSLHSLYPSFLKLSRQSAIPVTLWDCSELTQQARSVVDDRTLLIGVSQSGESAELVRLSQSARRPRISIALTSSGRNTLAEWADVSVRTNAGTERTVSTKTYTAGLAALSLVVATLLGDDVEAPGAAVGAAAGSLQRYLPAWKTTADQLVEFLGHEAPFAFIGRGANVATASIGSLITNEASKLACMSYSGGQFRHGPIELVREGFRCVIFESPDVGPGQLDRRLAESILDLGGRCAWVTAGASVPAPREGQLVIEMPECDASCLPLLNVVPVQLMQVPLATARGFVPAHFLNATKVTTIE